MDGAGRAAILTPNIQTAIQHYKATVTKPLRADAAESSGCCGPRCTVARIPHKIEAKFRKFGAFKRTIGRFSAFCLFGPIGAGFET